MKRKGTKDAQPASSEATSTSNVVGGDEASKSKEVSQVTATSLPGVHPFSTPLLPLPDVDNGTPPDGGNTGMPNAQGQPTNDSGGSFDFQALMQATIQTAVREAMSGAAQLWQTQQRHVTPDVTSATDGRMATASAQLVPVYDPSTKTQPTVEAWISRVDNLAAAYGWNDKQTTCFALVKLQGVAKTWYDGLTTAQRSWDE